MRFETTILGVSADTLYARTGLSESLDAEIAPFGLRSICIEPGYFRTKFISEGNRVPYDNKIEGKCSRSWSLMLSLSGFAFSQITARASPPGTPYSAVRVPLQ